MGTGVIIFSEGYPNQEMNVCQVDTSSFTVLLVVLLSYLEEVHDADDEEGDEEN